MRLEVDLVSLDGWVGRVAEHLEDPACASCHLITDPIGLGMENFDGIGRWRDTDHGAEIDASGDLDGDCDEDAAVFLSTNTGGSGNFRELVVVLNQDGEPDPRGSLFIGDRTRIDAVRIEDGVIVADLTTHGETDPLCCPTLAVERRYAWDGSAVQELPADGP